MADIIIIAALVIISAFIIRYLISERKKGHCPGCGMCSGGGACNHYAGKQNKHKRS